MDQLELSYQFDAAVDQYLAADEAALKAAGESDALADQLGMLDEDSPIKISAEEIPEYQRLWEEQHAEYSRLQLKATLALQILMQLRMQILPI